MQGFESSANDGHQHGHHCRHGSDTSNFEYVEGLQGSSSSVGFLGIGPHSFGRTLAIAMLVGLIAIVIVGAVTGNIHYPAG